MRQHPHGDELSSLADELWSTFIEQHGDLYDRRAFLNFRQKVEALNPSRDYRIRLGHIERAVRVLAWGGKGVSKSEAKRVFERDIPRMKTSAYWPEN